MRDDIVPPDTTTENKLQTELFRLRRLRAAVQKWNAMAASMGYDGVPDALQSLQEMLRPRPIKSKRKTAQRTGADQ